MSLCTSLICIDINFPSPFDQVLLLSCPDDGGSAGRLYVLYLNDESFGFEVAWQQILQYVHTY